MKKIVSLLLAFTASVFLCATYSDGPVYAEPTPVTVYISDQAVTDTLPPFSEVTRLTAVSEPKVLETIEEPEVQEPSIPEEDIELLALLTMAEAEAEPEEGQRLVIDTVLNRADLGGEFPSSIRDVIYQKNQYSGILSPRIDCCYVKEELIQLVREELENRTNYDVIFFNAGHYSRYGVPMFQVGHHYFSSYN